MAPRTGGAHPPPAKRRGGPGWGEPGKRGNVADLSGREPDRRGRRRAEPPPTPTLPATRFARGGREPPAPVRPLDGIAAGVHHGLQAPPTGSPSPLYVCTGASYA